MMNPEIDAHIELGGIPYPCAIVKGATNAPAGMTFIRLLEAVGKEGETSRNESSAYFADGTVFGAKWDGVTRHPSTGFPVFQLIDLLDYFRERD